MIFAPELARDVVIVSRTYGSADAHGNAAVTESLSDPHPGYIEPTGNREVLVDQSTQIATHLCVLFADVVVSGNEALEVDDVRYEIVGPPRRFCDGPSHHHVEIDLVLVTG